MNYTNWHINRNTFDRNRSVHSPQWWKTKWEKAAFRGSPVTLTARSECWGSPGNALAARRNVCYRWRGKMKTVIWHQKTWMWKTVSWVQTRLGSRCVKNCRLMLSFSWSRKPIIPTLEVVTTLHAFQWISLENFLQCQMLFLVQKTYVSWLAAANANCSQLGSLIDWTRLVYQPD